MKKIILFIAAMLFIGTAAQASEQKKADSKDRGNNRYHHKKQISFVENGILFHVYPNGEVDFTAPRQRNRNHTYWETSYNSPGRTRNYNRPTARYDYYGRLKKVGYTTIAYNRYDQTRRIGSVLIQYNRRGLISKIGGLHIRYNRAGKIQYVEGNVHYTGCGYCGVNGCSVSHNPYYKATTRHQHNSSRNHTDKPHYRKNKKKKKHS